MRLRDKVAVIYGGGGAIGGAVARAFAREGARVFLAGRTPEAIDGVAAEIRASGGRAETACVDALDERALAEHAAATAARAGSIDIAVNAIGIAHVQGVAFTELSYEQFAHPVAVYTRANFLTASAVAPHMLKRGAGVILTISTPGARLSARASWETASRRRPSRPSRGSWPGNLGPAACAWSACVLTPSPKP